MIEMRRLKNVVIFFQTILSFVLSRKIIIITIIIINNDFVILHLHLLMFLLQLFLC